jgi:hypothetical protein
MDGISAELALKSLGYEYLCPLGRGGSSELSEKKVEAPESHPPETLARWVLIFVAIAGRSV